MLGEEKLPKNKDVGLLLLRVTLGLIFLFGGLGKLGLVGGPGIEGFTGAVWNSLFLAYFVAIVELVAGALLLVGLLSRYVTIPLIIILLVAIVHVHLNEPSVILNRLALIAGLVEILLVGSGKYALKKD